MKKVSEKSSPEDIQKFITLKEKICENAELCLPNHNEKFIVFTDASNLAIARALKKKQQGTLRPVFWVSRPLLDREKNYSTTEKEFLAVVWTINQFKFI